MEIAFTDEQDALRRVIRRFVDERSTSAEVRALMATDAGFDRALWKQMAEQLGLQGLGIPEEFGGSGGGSVEIGIAFEETGRGLLVSPLMSTCLLAGQALIHVADAEARETLLPGLVDGSQVATVAIAEDAGSWDLDRVAMRATHGADGWRLSGTKMFVTDGSLADLVLVVARTEAGLALFSVPGSAAGLHRRELARLDLTRPWSRLEFSAAPAVLISGTADATEALRRWQDRVLAGCASEQVGGAGRCLDMAVDYAKQRVQFGRPIGSFQAIKHKLADVLVRLEAARSAAYYVNAALDTDAADARIACALAKAYCSEAYVQAAKDNIQVHGGIGFTWEHDAHLYLKRAKLTQVLFGSSVEHRARLARLTGIEAA
ncbi:acyl-CoA dehydrogenase family protein [Sporichthya polymorpha]|uniref:acyl-CoA dehydrogenase family protein n=1 Tax=Sporichthya polymorpha TaxID=35751 RepID=UPI00036A24BB|nr:acyl-CoA dehydrogenase family protein [Sporichthya polymorpha]